MVNRNWEKLAMKRTEPGIGGGTVALSNRCGEEIAVANDLDRAGDVDRRRHLIMVAGKPRPLAATHWQIFMLLYRHRGDVVYNDRIHAELSDGRDRPSAELIREHMRKLRKVLAWSRYQIVNYRSLGYELIIADTPTPLSATEPTNPGTRISIAMRRPSLRSTPASRASS
jgi:DNA-binding winged helix-turn-helix (wHTH) protein